MQNGNGKALFGACPEVCERKQEPRGEIDEYEYQNVSQVLRET